MYAVFDIGGTMIKYGAIELKEGVPSFAYQQEINSNAKILRGPGIQAKVMELIKELQARFDIQGIAISTAGMVDAKIGKILYANENIPEYTGLPLKENMESAFHIPCWVENDVNAAALGEVVFGSGKDATNVLMLTIGTGIGGAIILNQEVYHGSQGSAGEVGYMWVDKQPFQDIASTTSLVKNVERAIGETGLDGKMIFKKALDGNLICIQKIHELCEIIIKGVSNCVCILNPQVVILGGGIMTQKAFLAPIMKSYMKEFMNEKMLKDTQLRFATLNNQAGMVGAFAFYLKKEGITYA